MDLHMFFRQDPRWALTKVLASGGIGIWLFANYVYAWLMPGHDVAGYMERGTFGLTILAVVICAYFVKQVVNFVRLIEAPPLYVILDERRKLIVTKEYRALDISHVYHGYASWDEYLQNHVLLEMHKRWYGYELIPQGRTAGWLVKYRGFNILQFGYKIEIVDVNGDSISFVNRKRSDVLVRTLTALNAWMSVNEPLHVGSLDRDKMTAQRLAAKKRPKKVDVDIN